MNRRSDRSEIRISTTPEEALDLLERLASDDSFRGRFERSPRKVLEEFHFYIPEEEMPERVELPAGEELHALVEEMREAVASKEPGQFMRFKLFSAFARFKGVARFKGFRGA